MSEFQPLIDQRYREDVLRARKLTMEQRFLGSLELSEVTMAMARGGARSQLPNAIEEKVRSRVAAPAPHRSSSGRARDLCAA